MDNEEHAPAVVNPLANSTDTARRQRFEQRFIAKRMEQNYSCTRTLYEFRSRLSSQFPSPSSLASIALVAL